MNINGCQLQIVMYAKGWYGKSEVPDVFKINGLMSDVKSLLAVWSKNDKETIRDRDVLSQLARTYEEVLPTNLRAQGLLEILDGKDAGWEPQVNRAPIEIMLDLLSNYDCDLAVWRMCKLDISFGDGDNIAE